MSDSMSITAPAADTTPAFATGSKAPTQRRAPALPDRIEAICFAAPGAAIVYSTASGSYTTLTTPRSLPYLIVGAILLFGLSVAAWLGVFHADERLSFRFLVTLVIPALLIAVPFQSDGGTGFDAYAAGRAIAIRRDARKPTGFAHLHGFDEERKTITISDDEFGSWFFHIDHNPQRYIGYQVRLTGFVYKPSTLGVHEFELSRQFMSCCILDMTPFGFATHYAKAAHLREHDWVSVDATLVQGTYGIAGHERQGPMLKITSLRTAKTAPNGYFYWQ